MEGEKKEGLNLGLLPSNSTCKWVPRPLDSKGQVPKACWDFLLPCCHLASEVRPVFSHRCYDNAVAVKASMCPLNLYVAGGKGRHDL